jgi:hypothetical protein
LFDVILAQKSVFIVDAKTNAGILAEIKPGNKPPHMVGTWDNAISRFGRTPASAPRRQLRHGGHDYANSAET